MNKLKILIVEDKQDKVKLLKPIIESNDVDSINTVNVLDAKKELMIKKFDIVLIDIQIPDNMTSDVNLKGGIELLNWIEISSKCIKPKRVFGITSDSQTKIDYDQYFISRGFHLIESHIDDESWLESISSTCKYLLNEEVESEEKDFDIAIITALGHNELREIRSLPLEWIEFSLLNDPNIYYKTILKTSAGEEKSIVASHCSRMGLSAASSLATKMILKFTPTFIIMTGITAGVKGKTNFGDILAADPCWDWGNGKLTLSEGKPKFSPAPHQLPLSAKLRSLFQRISVNGTYLEEIEKNWKDDKPVTKLKLIVGPVASGAVVLEDPGTLETITSHHRETIGIEMEGYGVMIASQLTKNEKTTPIIIKSVCDFANIEKNDNWQNYASYTSAMFAFYIIKNELFNIN